MRSLLDHKRWVLKAAASPAPGYPAALSEVFVQLLFDRSKGQPERFLNRLDLYPPERLGGVEAATERLVRARREGGAVFVHGDFDVDGITSTALLYLGLKELGFGRVKVEIEDRQRGHGLNDAVVQRLIAEDFSLLLTADCGISDGAPIAALRRAGIDTIVTDHHQPPARLPEAAALVNPKLPDCAYPNKDLAGVGVAFQLLRALYARLGRPPEEAHRFLDLVALGTVADLVPLVRDGENENQRLVRAGLERLAGGEGNLGFLTLIEALGLKPERLSAGSLSFIVAPHLNAANRVGDPRVALLLLTTSRAEHARYLVEVLQAYNQDRKRAQDGLRERVEQAIRQGQVDLERERLIWLEGEGWNPGILGLVASDVVERYGYPAILVSRQGAMGRASARSIGPFNMIRCLQAHEAAFLRYGGHAMAAGFTIDTRQLPELRAAVLAYAREHLRDLEGPVHEVDGVLPPEQIDLKLHEELQQLAPFGIGNPTPKFLLPRVRLRRLQAVGEGKHLKCLAEANGCAFEAIGFSMGEHLDQLAGVDEVGLVFKLGRNEWMGRVSVQLELADVVEPSDF